MSGYISPVYTPAIGLVGTATNDSAAAGKIGEYMEAVLSTGSAHALTTNTVNNIVSIELTAGDWDLDGLVKFESAAATSVTTQEVGFATDATTLSNADLATATWGQAAATDGSVDYRTIQAPATRVSLAATTTYYLNCKALFGVSTMTAYGKMRARRVR